jgi:GNAT superfamily N-acetyltransferase
MSIVITRPSEKDLPELKKIFQIVISHTFKQDGIGHLKEAIEEEVEKQMNFVNLDLQSTGQEMYFLLAKGKDKIIGTGAFGKPSQDVRKQLKIEGDNVPEITSFYVLPGHQEKGVGSLLYNAILLSLLVKNVKEVCLDGGYQKSIIYWTRKIGEPDVVLPDYFGKGLKYVFWRRKLAGLNIEFKT